MTSSLVGSEMCIRDRPTGMLVDLLSVSTPDQYSTRRDFGGRASIATPLSCLLYTSDAADDM
eukprot:2419273-Prorocentrum_lima.AAC.1